MASPPSFRISPETRSGPTDLFFPIAPILLLMILISIVNGSPVFSLYMRHIAVAAEYRRIIEIKQIGLLGMKTLMYGLKMRNNMSHAEYRVLHISSQSIINECHFCINPKGCF